VCRLKNACNASGEIWSKNIRCAAYIFFPSRKQQYGIRDFSDFGGLLLLASGELYFSDSEWSFSRSSTANSFGSRTMLQKLYDFLRVISFILTFGYMIRDPSNYSLLRNLALVSKSDIIFSHSRPASFIYAGIFPHSPLHRRFQLVAVVASSRHSLEWTFCRFRVALLMRFGSILIVAIRNYFCSSETVDGDSNTRWWHDFVNKK